MSSYTAPSPTITEFTNVLSEETDWYTFGTFMGVSANELDNIGLNYPGIMRCLIEMYKCIESMGLPLSWEHIVKSLRNMKNHSLADRIHSKYIIPSYQLFTSDTSSPVDQKQHVYIGGDDSSEAEVINALVREFVCLSKELTLLTLEIKIALKQASVNINHLQDLIETQCGLEPLPEEKATIDAVFGRLCQHCSLLNLHGFLVLVNRLLEGHYWLKKEIGDYANQVDQFKWSAKMMDLVHLIKAKQTTTDKHKTVKLRVKESLSPSTTQQFEITVNEILRFSYKLKTQISVVTSRTQCTEDPYTTEEEGKSL